MHGLLMVNGKTSHGIAAAPPFAWRDRSVDPANVLDPRPGGIAEHAGRRFAGHPVIAFIIVTLIGFAVLAATTVAVGWALKTYALPEHGIGHADEHVNVWLADHRTPLRTDVSFWLSGIGDVYAIPALVAISTIVASSCVSGGWAASSSPRSLWRPPPTAYDPAVTARPNVRLDQLPVSASYYSGHTASYLCTAASLCSSPRAFGTALSARGVGGGDRDPLLVGLSRMYRGMHPRPTTPACWSASGWWSRWRTWSRRGGRQEAGPVVTRVAVIAPPARASTADARNFDGRWRVTGCRSFVGRGAQSRKAPKQVERLLSRTGTGIRLGRRRRGSSAASARSPGRARSSRSSRPGRQTCWPRTWAFPDIEEPWSPGCTAGGAIDLVRRTASDSRSWPGGLRCRHDQPRRRRTEGHARRARHILTGTRSFRDPPSRLRSRLTATRGTAGRRAASWPATSGAVRRSARLH